uniref:C1-FDX n=1 Tax=Polytomella sp. Pringsheim 198.80 TaxID=37502 RepID=UPI0016FA47BD|nr:Chain O, C1-FDX [Polytomella sp. Pringsheim 198.80]7ARD_O Chain O, C1-FDX [Polytomella sp. Pringsheim 198.80]|eukprot:CAMPEP_0175043240 /NCGR_PEP_ID=MMETSP0052_2-20121109/3057_1 /TAXON_ID=51329 ORGANISM="Polytomella parva, Strain SAG 63-3" /NCGR_SAMPLE_ID=MMETSP0052_2 /ASSEMBLY_ACC=CAM_ASM_000194 /LENGTH=200 /DNA_ID=CAMNT_0016306237 /DNA_START=36 /DNA_END=638 /DNA_ORIENTATION=-
MALLRALAKPLRSLQAVSSVAQVSLRQFGAASHHDDHHDDHDHYTPPKTVFEDTITINVLDYDGKKHAVKALIGTPLNKALVEYGFSSTYFFPNMGYYTQHISDAHVFIPEEYWKYVENVDLKTDDAEAIKLMFKLVVQDYQRETSFFASYLTLNKEMDNMTIGFGPIKPWHITPKWSFNGHHNVKDRMFDRLETGPFIE